MVNNSSLSHIKRSQKEANLLRIISGLFMKIRIEDDRLNDIFINRVELSKAKSMVNVFFYAQGGQESFKKALRILTLYKPSMRKGVADSTSSRYVPDLHFLYDAKFEKEQKLQELLNQVGDDLGEE